MQCGVYVVKKTQRRTHRRVMPSSFCVVAMYWGLFSWGATGQMLVFGSLQTPTICVSYIVSPDTQKPSTDSELKWLHSKNIKCSIVPLAVQLVSEDIIKIMLLYLWRGYSCGWYLTETSSEYLVIFFVILLKWFFKKNKRCKGAVATP